MEVFSLVLSQMLMMFSFIAVGFALRKLKLLPSDSDKTFSRLETYVLVPALNFFNQLTNCTAETLSSNIKLTLYGGAVFIEGLIIAQPLASFFVRDVRDDVHRLYERNVYRYAMSFSNFGFIGNFLVLGLWGQEGLFRYTLFCFIITIFCNSWGLFILIPKGGASMMQSLIKGFTAPPLISLLAGCVGGLVGVKAYIPSFLMSALESAGNCMGPLAMILAGFVIGGYELKGLISNKKIYIASLLRLVVIPAAMLFVLHLLGTEKEIMAFILIAFAAPLGLNTIVYPAAYGGDTKTGAAMALVSNILGVITIPIMYYLFIVLL